MRKGNSGAAVKRISVMVFGDDSRIGRAVCEAVRRSSDLKLVDGCDYGRDARSRSSHFVAVDLGEPGLVTNHLSWAIQNNIDIVFGMPEITDHQIDCIRDCFSKSSATIAVILIENFSRVAMLLKRFVRSAAPYFDTIDVTQGPCEGRTEQNQCFEELADVLGTNEYVRETVRDDPFQSGDVTAAFDSQTRVRVHASALGGQCHQIRVTLGGRDELLTICSSESSIDMQVREVLHAIRNSQTLAGVHVGLSAMYDGISDSGRLSSNG